VAVFKQRGFCKSVIINRNVFAVTWHNVPGGYLPAFRFKLAVPIFKVEALTLVISLLKVGNYLTGYAAPHYARSQQSEYFVILLCNLRQSRIVMMLIVGKVANSARLSYDGFTVVRVAVGKTFTARANYIGTQ
jgi:hypothetical protein